MTEQTTITNDDLSVKDMVFEMEDRLRHAQDFLDLLNDRLALIGRPIDKREQSRLSRVAGEAAVALTSVVEQYYALIESVGAKADTRNARE